MNEKQIRERLLADEYEIQHFGFSSTYFLTEYKDYINYLIKSSLEKMEDCIARRLELPDEQKKELHANITTLIETYAKETDSSFKRNEESIRNIFLIPRNVSLSMDKIHTENEDIDEQQLLNEVEQLEVQYLKEKSLSFLYEEEIKHIDRTSELQKQVSKLLKQIDNIPDSNDSVTQFNKLYNLYNDLLHRFDTECNTNTLRNRLLVSDQPSYIS